MLAAALFALPSRSGAEDFSFYGVRFGMTKEEIGEKWLALSEDFFTIPSPFIRDVVPRFDHEGKLYEVSFTIDLQMDDPPVLVNRAFQELVESKWGKPVPEVDLQMTLSRGSSALRLTNRNLRDAYINHIKGKIAPLIQP